MRGALAITSKDFVESQCSFDYEKTAQDRRAQRAVTPCAFSVKTALGFCDPIRPLCPCSASFRCVHRVLCCSHALFSGSRRRHPPQAGNRDPRPCQTALPAGLSSLQSQPSRPRPRMSGSGRRPRCDDHCEIPPPYTAPGSQGGDRGQSRRAKPWKAAWQPSGSSIESCRRTARALAWQSQRAIRIFLQRNAGPINRLAISGVARHQFRVLVIGSAIASRLGIQFLRQESFGPETPFARCTIIRFARWLGIPAIEPFLPGLGPSREHRDYAANFPYGPQRRVLGGVELLHLIDQRFHRCERNLGVLNRARGDPLIIPEDLPP